MATPSQFLADRRNAPPSTGPRSVEGKAVSPFNALKTGIQAKSLVIPGEVFAELQQLADDYHLQFQPSNPLERFLVDSLVTAEWQLRRYRTLEARLWERSLASDVAGLGEAYQRNLQIFTRLHRRLEAVERSYHRTLHELKLLQTAAHSSRPAPSPRPVAPAPAPAPQPLAPAPAPELASFRPVGQPTSAAPAVPREENKALRL